MEYRAVIDVFGNYLRFYSYDNNNIVRMYKAWNLSTGEITDYSNHGFTLNDINNGVLSNKQNTTFKSANSKNDYIKNLEEPVKRLETLVEKLSREGAKNAKEK